MATYTARGETIIQWPNRVKPREITMRIVSNTSRMQSPFTRTEQTVKWPGALVMLDASFPPIPSGPVLNEYGAFVARLDGAAGRFIFPAYTCRYQPPGIGAAERVTFIPLTADDTFITADSTLVTADAERIQMETIFTFAGSASSTEIAGYLYFNSNKYPLGVNSWVSWDDADGWRHLHKVVDMVHNVTTGQALLTIRPAMRAVPTLTTPIHVHAPSGIFQLADDDQGHPTRTGRLSSFTVSARQSFPLKVVV